MLVMKFGGTSVANADRIRHAAALVLREQRAVVVVTSAMGGVTDELLRLGACARDRHQADVDALLAEFRRRHETAADEVTDDGPTRRRLRDHVDALVKELRQLAHGVSLLRELSESTADLIVSMGERASAPILAAAITTAGRASEAVDARTFITVRAAGAVDDAASRRAARDRLLPIVERAVPVVTGFVASTKDGRTTTLGRGGSDYTATLVGAWLGARAIWIWTDVDGVMTADPRVVPEARVLDVVSYREAAEAAYFGSKVLHPSTMIPAVESRIPVIIRNTFNPDHPGTRIAEESPQSKLGVKTVTSVADLAMVTVEGSGMIGVPGVAERVFRTTARLGTSVYMVSQASSEHNISFVVNQGDAGGVVEALDAEFELEIARNQVDRVGMIAPVGIVAIIGDGMKGTPGISQRLFTALGRGRINVLAIAQGSSELNLSVVVHADDLRRAVGATHSRFGLTRDTHLVLLGKGLVGSALLRQIIAARSRLASDHGIGLIVSGICGRRDLLLNPGGIEEATLQRVAAGEALDALGGEPRPTDAALFERLAGSRWLDVIVIDVTAEDHGRLHRDALRHGFHVVTANKKPMSGPLDEYETILREAAAHGVTYQFETTFGAGLPALSSLQDLVATCDTVKRVTGCFSGTFGFLCDQLHAGMPLSEAVRAAQARGYTEPDPRDDLNGTDVARKALIIARQLGSKLEMRDIDLEPLVSDELLALPDVDSFLARLPEMDEAMRQRVADAEAGGRVLRFVAEITPERVSVGLRAVSRDDAAGQLSGPDNILVFQTERYDEQPLVIRGPGAGADVTAAGVLGDILKVVRAS
ncbi:MAG: bifunctional aspartate kinase/homoserine dehydrogenase I [Planctomycetes bacterium]|nr:bifunctional aspartate kinase/homoserine dehydrogenase I [Planctomycetota bacterium]